MSARIAQSHRCYFCNRVRHANANKIRQLAIADRSRFRGCSHFFLGGGAIFWHLLKFEVRVCFSVVRPRGIKTEITNEFYDIIRATFCSMHDADVSRLFQQHEMSRSLEPIRTQKDRSATSGGLKESKMAVLQQWPDHLTSISSTLIAD